MLFFGIPESQCPAYTGPGAPGMATQETNMEASVGAFGADTIYEQSGTSTASFAEVIKQGENCSELVFEFCEKLLNIKDSKSNIQTECAHRIGARKPYTYPKVDKRESQRKQSFTRSKQTLC